MPRLHYHARGAVLSRCVGTSKSGTMYGKMTCGNSFDALYITAHEKTDRPTYRRGSDVHSDVRANGRILVIGQLNQHQISQQPGVATHAWCIASKQPVLHNLRLLSSLHTELQPNLRPHLGSQRLALTMVWNIREGGVYARLQAENRCLGTPYAHTQFLQWWRARRQYVAKFAINANSRQKCPVAGAVTKTLIGRDVPLLFSLR